MQDINDISKIGPTFELLANAMKATFADYPYFLCVAEPVEHIGEYHRLRLNGDKDSIYRCLASTILHISKIADDSPLDVMENILTSIVDLVQQENERKTNIN